MADEKVDPLSKEFFNPLVQADWVADILFYGAAVLSITALLVNKASYPGLHDLVHIVFLLSAIGLFCATLSIRLYFFPRAQVARFRDFVSHALGKQHTHKKTIGYYNTSAPIGPKRTAAQVLESSFFTTAILRDMARTERAKIFVYVAVWLIAMAHRQTELALIVVVAQIVFSEQVLARWLRLEWFRIHTEQIHEQLFRLFQVKSNLDVTAPEFVGRYEIVKATSAISLSQRVFNRKVQSLNAEWEQIRLTLGI